MSKHIKLKPCPFCGIWDYRDDPEGILYAKDYFPTEQCQKHKSSLKKNISNVKRY